MKALLIGDHCIDKYHYGFVDRMSPEAPVPVFRFDREEVREGMAGNVQSNLASFGCKVESFFGTSSVKTRLIDLHSKQHIVRIDDDVHSVAMEFDQLPKLDHDCVVISDYNKGFVSYQLIKDIRKNYAGPVFVDTKKTDLSKLEGCIVKINSSEYEKLIFKCSHLIVTCGSRGAYYNGKHFPAKPVEVADVCGAGDTFLAALAYKYCLSCDIEEAMQFAIRASSVTVQKIGVYAPKLSEI